MASEEEQVMSHKRWCGGACCGGACCGAAADEKAERAEREPWEAEWRVAAAEALGTALLVSLSCLPSCAPDPLPPAHKALAAGLVVALLVQSLDHVSGAMFNPTVTLAALVWGRVSPPRAAVMLCGQLAGACAGALLLHAAAAAAPPAAHPVCLTLPAPGLSLIRAVGIEAVLGGCLALVNCGMWDARNRGLLDSWPLRIGVTVAGLSLAAGELTGASMNPMRSLGPSLAAGDFTAHWVYWVGPLGGSLCFTALYRAVWRPPPHCEPRALRDQRDYETARALHDRRRHSAAAPHHHAPA